MYADTKAQCGQTNALNAQRGMCICSKAALTYRFYLSNCVFNMNGAAPHVPVSHLTLSWSLQAKLLML